MKKEKAFSKALIIIATLIAIIIAPFNYVIAGGIFLFASVFSFAIWIIADFVDKLNELEQEEEEL